MLMTAGLMASATLAKVPVVSGICTGMIGRLHHRGGGLRERRASPGARATSRRRRRPMPAISARMSAPPNVLRLSCIMSSSSDSSAHPSPASSRFSRSPSRVSTRLSSAAAWMSTAFLAVRMPADPVLRAVQDRADLLVDRAGGGVAVLALAAHARALEEERRALAVGGEPQPLGHPVLRHHQPRQLGGALEVVVGAGGDLAVHELLGHAAAQQHGDAVLQLAARHQEAVLGRELVGHARARPRRAG